MPTSDRPNRLIVILVSLIALLVAAGCGPMAPTPAERASTAGPPPSTEKTVVTVAYNGYFEQTFGPAPPPIEALQAAVARQYPDIEVRLNIMPYEVGPWRDNYLTWFQAQDGETDLLGVNLYWLPEFAEAGWLLPLDDRLPAATLAPLNPAYVDAFTYKNDLLALGPWWGGIGGLYYRQDLLAEQGFEPPQTYADLLAITAAIRATHPNLTGWTWPALKDQALVNRWTEFLHGFGGTPFDDSGACAMAGPEGIAALELMQQLIDSGVTPREALTWKEEEAQIRFVSGEAIFHIGRQDMMFWLDDPEQSQVVGKWGFAPMPGATGTGAGFFEGWGFAVNRYSDNPEAALKVLEVMFGFEVQKAFNLSQGPVQAHAQIYSDPDVIDNNPNMPRIEAVANTAIPPISSPYYAEISLILQEELHTALSGGKPAAEALQAACAQIDALQ